MMSSQLRYIVERLNTPPFSRRYNLVSFDSLGPPALLQVLNDVLAEISPDHRVDLREEPPDQTALRMFSLLRILKYRPEADEGGGLNAFRHGLLDGEKGTVYPLLQWLLERSGELKKRAYLAKYLVRIEVPAEFLQDEAAVEMQSTYQDLVEEFKELHKTVEQQRSIDNTHTHTHTHTEMLQKCSSLEFLRSFYTLTLQVVSVQCGGCS